MEIKEFLNKNNIIRSQNGYENLANIIGKEIWICSYELNDDIYKRMRREIKPTKVIICDAKDTKKTVYHSPIFFKHKNKEIMLFERYSWADNPKSLVYIFENENDCKIFFKEQLLLNREMLVEKLENVKILYDEKINKIDKLIKQI